MALSLVIFGINADAQNARRQHPLRRNAGGLPASRGLWRENQTGVLGFPAKECVPEGMSFEYSSLRPENRPQYAGKQLNDAQQEERQFPVPRPGIRGAGPGGFA
jgi:hypothetical protein